MFHHYPHRSQLPIHQLLIGEQRVIPSGFVRSRNVPVRIIVLKSVKARIPDNRYFFRNLLHNAGFYCHLQIVAGAGAEGVIARIRPCSFTTITVLRVCAFRRPE